MANKQECVCTLLSIAFEFGRLIAIIEIIDDEANRFSKWKIVRTSTIVKHKVKSRTIETLNTIYHY